MIRVKPLSCYNTSQEVVGHWSRMSQGAGRWNDLELTADDDVDVWVILNAPPQGATFVAERTVVFQMEPSMAERPQTWGEWARPDPRRFLAVRDHGRYPNVAEWHLARTYQELRRPIEASVKSRRLSAVVSSLALYPGHRKRLAFLHALEAAGVPIDIYGRDNAAGFANYRGPLPTWDKTDGLWPYRYTFAAENHWLRNYATEKIHDAILSECLCFYWGCPNLEHYVEQDAFERLDLDDLPGAVERVRQTLAADPWESRLPAIRRAKTQILDRLQFFPTLERILAADARVGRRRDRHPQPTARQPHGLGLAASFRKIYCLNLARSSERWAAAAEQFRCFGLDVERREADDGETLAVHDLVASGVLAPSYRRTLAAGELGALASHVGLWRTIAAAAPGWYLVLEDDCRLHPALADPRCWRLYWESLPADAALVYLGHSSPCLDGPDDDATIEAVSRFVDERVVRLTHPVSGTFAYALTPTGAQTLLDHALPLATVIDDLDPNLLPTYALRRIGDPWALLTPPGFYQNRSSWSDQATVQLHGVISVAEQPSTIGRQAWPSAPAAADIDPVLSAAARQIAHYGRTPHDGGALLRAGDMLRQAGRHELAYLLLDAAAELAERPPDDGSGSGIDAASCLDALSVSAFYSALPGRRERGRQALDALVERLAASPAGRERLRHEGPRLRQNARFYGDSPLGPSSRGDDPRPRVAIVCGGAIAGEEWDPETLDTRGTGGSEKAVIGLAASLVALGCRVVVYGNPPATTLAGFASSNPRYVERDRFAEHTRVAGDDRFEAVIVWRHPWAVDEVAPWGRASALWLHDAFAPGVVTRATTDRLTAVFWLSQYQYATAGGVEASAPERTFFTSNGLVGEHFTLHDGAPRDPYRCVYASNYQRGLEVVLDAWPAVRSAFPRARLDVYYGFQTWGPTPAGWEDALRRKLVELHPLDVHEHGRIGQQALAGELCRSSFWTYPCTYPETFCTTGLEAQMAGCVPVYIPNGALGETVCDGFACTRTEDFAATLHDALAAAEDADRLEPLRRRLRAWAECSSWELIARSWCRWLGLTPAGLDVPDARKAV